MTTFLAAHFRRILARRGYTMDEVRECIVAQDGSRITVDETHPAYPRETKPGFVQKAVNFTKATARHVANRGRQCSDEEIAARFAICQACPRLVNEHCTHPKCGCGISPKRAIVSKLSWASERCPEGKWERIG